TVFVKRAIEKITTSDALKNTIFVVARASDSAPINYLAPLTSIRIAEELASKGMDVLIIFDNLTRHARIYRQISLLLKRAPGREAYPGDIFYLHSSLLEKCGRFDESVGGGSITAIPLVETSSSDITDYITTNLMSITDGHVLFTRVLYHQDRFPAVSTDYSVSRIGGRAQKPVFRDLSHKLKVILGRYHEIENLTSFGTEIQQETSKLIERGKKIFFFINQDQNTDITIVDQCAVIYFVVSDYIFRWPLEIMSDLAKVYLNFLARPENQEKVQKAFELSTLDEAKPIYEKICQDFLSDPQTIRPLEEKDIPADKENITDLLKTMNQK
ncbi:MAG TPA: hypothetical protein VMQ44_02750, partial [Candidatus Saccharimonadales bacterium]|nr:hypothetical protein [Candidatus Saccharimonadales bacterium]